MCTPPSVRSFALPWMAVMLSSVSASSLVANRPSVQMTRGLMMRYLLHEMRAAGLDLVGRRVAILRRTALDHVGDVDVGPR